eukprot:CAMPEP_0176389850 /NCGR_PEP_ID=MMETSP0126-20121128/38709_1 /TAXON_ID=141414 ORGANISM="Strombidinopsis acuminatum, Strain SPMC142" /NCGR_SAMPLE_ID=MMETSP0126 /ASSEMBLY_ACC=CAM_ASM_000229 /LENGTH=37 /DNA_ID= /DNA_START= /DNA_END= /DNA_ORIENTATION=
MVVLVESHRETILSMMMKAKNSTILTSIHLEVKPNEC